MARIRALVAQSREEAIQEYKANFKDTDDYLDQMRDATVKYKESLKWVDPSFDADYYDRLILGEPQTPAPEDPVGFDQLDLIGTLGIAVTNQAAAPASQDAAQPVETTPNQGAAQPAVSTALTAPTN